MTSNPTSVKRAGTGPVVSSLALLDLRHEWVLTLCMVLAIAAVLAPLLILLGLKNGTVETMRERLVEDPVNREIKPSHTLSLAQSWFDDLARREDVAFSIPTILRGSSTVRIARRGERVFISVDMIPTGDGDPLVLENGGRVPAPGEVVLSSAAAEKLRAAVGDTVTARVTRTRGRKREQVTVDLRVAAVLSPRADPLERIYATLGFVTDVESYREGRAVPARGWDGTQPRPYLSFTDAYVVALESLSRLQARRLTINTGFADVQLLDAAGMRKALGFDTPPGATVYRLTTLGNTVQASNIDLVRNKLRGKRAVVLPFVALDVMLEWEGAQREVFPVGLSLRAEDARALGLPALPWGKLDPQAGFDKLGQVLLPAGWEAEQGQTLGLRSGSGDFALQLPLTVSGTAFGDRVVVPAELMGALRTARNRPVVFDAERRELLLAKAGFRGFRLFARSIDDVPTLYRFFLDQGIDVITQVQEIERIKILDRGLTRIFVLVALVGIVGGLASLIASLYAAVERKKRDISVLRLMGLSRLEVFRFPIYQGVAMAVMGVLFATAGYASLAWVINFVFSADLQMGEKICTLPNSYFLVALLATAGGAALSALVAAVRTTRIDPAEAIREE
jgi:putative ABC transport system permease protein